MNFDRKIPIQTSGLNAQLLKQHADNRQGSLILGKPIVDGIDHAPAHQTLPPPVFKITGAKPKPKGNAFTDLFSARKENL